MARDHLSKQTHYDWGLRSIVATLKMAANLRQMNADVSETVIVLRALRDVNLSKLVGEDGLLFYGLLRVCCCYLPLPAYHVVCLWLLLVYMYMPLRMCVQNFSKAYFSISIRFRKLITT